MNRAQNPVPTSPTHRGLNPHRWLAIALAAHLGLGQPLLAFAQEAPPAPRPADGRATVTESANGTPVVNIAAPNAAGVSHNRFSSYDVGTRGLVLNNSAENAVSLIGGGVIGNQNLANGPAASLILNEVTGRNATSLLQGYQEVLGPSAELVIANPWGITCDGCGFVNTPRVTLTTGTPTMAADGSLQGFTITGGTLAVGADGLDASRQQALDLLAREVRIGGDVFGGHPTENVSGDVQVVGGAHQFDYATRAGSALPDAAPGSAPQIAIDSSALGGIYADRIRLLVNEQGAGVRAAGHLAATANDLTIDANGHVELRAASSAAGNIAVRGTDVTVDQAGENPFVYAAGDLTVNASGALTLGAGGIGAEGATTFGAGSITDNGGDNDLRFAGDNGSLTANAAGDVTLNGGYWTAPTLSVSGSSVTIGTDAVLYGTAAAGDALALEAVNGLNIEGGAYSAADARLRGDVIETGAAGVAAATGTLDVASHDTTGGVFNRGQLSGGTVNIDAGVAGNAGLLYAAERLSVRGNLLVNDASGEVVSGGDASIVTTNVHNDGTIWADNDLSVDTATLRQELNAGGEDAIIGAGRDLSIASAGAFTLGAGDLYAGRDLSIRATRVTDVGALGADADLRYAGRDLDIDSITSVQLDGGQYVAEGSLTVEGDSIYLSGQDMALFGAQGGSGTTSLTARSGGIALLDGASVYSGNDLAIRQPNGFQTSADNVLHADGTLSIDADVIDNAGTLSGAVVALGTNERLDNIVNRGTGVIYGSERVEIGNGAQGLSAGAIVNEAATTAEPAGIFGGAVDFHADSLHNRGLFEIEGGQISVLDFLNDGGAELRSFSAGSASPGLNISSLSMWNEGFLYDSGLLSLSARTFYNAADGVIGSAGDLRLRSAGPLANTMVNDGSLWSWNLDIQAERGFINGRDRGIAANRAIPGSIYADNLLDIYVGAGSAFINYGDIESSGTITIWGGANASGETALFRNEMSMVDDSELIWHQGGSATSVAGDLGGQASSPRGGSGDRSTFTYDGDEYYWFYDFWSALDGPSSYAYLDRRATYTDTQGLTPEAAAIRRPSIRAGNDIYISDFQTVTNLGGIIGADRNLFIHSDLPGASVNNLSHNLYWRQRHELLTGEYRCLSIFGAATHCSVRDSLQSLGPVGGFTPSVSFGPTQVLAPAFAGQIYAGNYLEIDIPHGTLNNVNNPTPYAGVLPQGPGVLGVTVTPGTSGATGSAPQLDFGGLHIPLPTSAHGRFVSGRNNEKGPLIETNPLFGVDSIRFGSDYLVKLLGLTPEEQARRLGDDNYEAWLIQEQMSAATGRSVLANYYGVGDMIASLYDNAAEEAERLELGFGKALTPEQVAALKSDIVWMVEQEIQGQKVLVPVVYLSEATRAGIDTRASISGHHVNILADTVRNVGGNITATDGLAIRTTGNIENLSGRMAGWNVQLDAGGDIVNSTLTRRSGTAENGRDVAERTATIEAGNTAILRAARDVNVSGAWVLAGKDAALIAGRNVNIESQALNIDQTHNVGDDSYSRSTQVLQGGGVVAGRNLQIDAQTDVNLRGADVSAGGTALLRAREGNVNIGVRTLTDTVSSSQTRSGRYDTIERDVENGQLGIGMGTEDRTTTHQGTETIGVGSRVAGSGVVITTGRGDVNIQGSDIVGGEDGVLVDSARDVNITAYYNTRETTDTVDTLRAGARIDGSYDGVHVGTQVSGSSDSTNTRQTSARTSSISSAGDVVIRGKGDVDNEGTRIDAAGNVYLVGENVTNRAAYDTYTNTNERTDWDTRQQVGFTANGTGSSIAGVAQGESDQVQVNNLEAQVRLTGSGSNTTSTIEARSARTTDIKAGGNIVVLANNAALDEGTQYQAGENLVISADSYENRAAADTVSITTEGTRGSGQITAGLTSAAEISGTASAEGSHDTSSDATSTAVTGTMRAGGNVIISARRGDVMLEGTQIEGDKGVSIRAAGDVDLRQANDTRTTSNSGESGSARLSGSMSVTGTSGGVGVGASGRTYEQEENTSEARTVNIRSGDGSISIDAGRNLTSQGANFDAGKDVNLAARGDIDLAAATSSTTRTGSVDGGGADLNVGFGMGDAKGTGSVGASVDAERARTNYTETNETGSNIRAGNRLTINAGGNARLEGVQAEAAEADLRTGGNLLLESAQRTVSDDSYNVTAHVEASGSKGQGSRGATGVSGGGAGSNSSGATGGNAAGGNVGANVQRSYQDIETNTNTTITTRGRTDINTGGDLTLAGANVDAGGGVRGTVGGDLTIESRVDREVVQDTQVNAYVGVGAVGSSASSGKFDKGQDAFQMGANTAAQTGAFADIDSSSKDNLTVGRRSGIGGSGGVRMTVEGNTTLTGAANQASDFDTRGTTTVTDVETRTNETSIDERHAYTVASAAGSNSGKGGDFSLSVNIPDGPAPRRDAGDTSPDPVTRQRADALIGNRNTASPDAPTRRADSNPNSTPDAPTRPRVDSNPDAMRDAPTRPRADSAADATRDAPTRPRADSAADATRDAPTRPRADTLSANEANRDAPSPRVTAAPAQDAPDAVRRPASSPQGDNTRRPPAQPADNVNANRDATSPRVKVNTDQGVPDANRRQVSAGTPDNDTRRPPTQPANDANTVRREADAPTRRDNEPPAAPDRVARQQDQDLYNTEPTDEPTRPASDARMLLADNAPNRPRDADAADVREAPRRGSDYENEDAESSSPYENDEATPATGRNVRRPQQQPAAPQSRIVLADELDAASRARLQQDPAFNELLDQAPAKLRQLKDLREFNHVLLEIEAFTSRPEYANLRQPLLDQLNASMQTLSADADGLYEFPLFPMFVGENIEGFGNWFVRRAERAVRAEAENPPDPHPPGTVFGNPPVRYFTPEEQARNRMFVGDDGRLYLGDRDTPLPNGNYMFVVDMDGRIILGQQEVGRLHHSSLSAGRPVRMAGEMSINDGRITVLNNKSGHFRPAGEALQIFRAELRDLRVPLGESAAEHAREAPPSPARRRMLQALDLPAASDPSRRSAAAPSDARQPARQTADPDNNNARQRTNDDYAFIDAVRETPRAADAITDNDTLRQRLRDEYEFIDAAPAVPRPADMDNDLARRRAAEDNARPRAVEDNAPPRAVEEHASRDTAPRAPQSRGEDADDARPVGLVPPSYENAAPEGVRLPRATPDDIRRPDAQAVGARRGDADSDVARRHDNSALDAAWPERWPDKPDPAEAQRRNEHEVLVRVNRDPELNALMNRLADRDGLSQDAARNNLAEIDAFTERPQNRELRDPLLRRMADSVEGPRQRDDGHTLFPLQPPYVGEDVQGFINWRYREQYGDERIGTLYDIPNGYREDPVKYFTPEEQADSRIVVMRDGSIRMGPDQKKLENGKYIFVVLPDGRMIAAPESVSAGHLHHSSLGRGERVLMAGEFTVEAGRIRQISNQSGHYRPSMEAYRAFLRDLSKSGIRMKGLTATQVYSQQQNRQGAAAMFRYTENLLSNPLLLKVNLPPMLAPLKAPKPAKARKDANKNGKQSARWIGPSGGELRLAA